MRIEHGISAGLVIDIQEKLFPHMDNKALFLKKSTILIKGLKILGVPLVVTEQYPRGLGGTIPEISELLDRQEVIEKMSFSCCDEPAVLQSSPIKDRKTVILCGIETHVCVLQTVVDLIGYGYNAVVVEDCTTSRSIEDKRVAVERMRREGAVVTTCESILFELARISGTEEFKAISRLVK